MTMVRDRFKWMWLKIRVCRGGISPVTLSGKPRVRLSLSKASPIAEPVVSATALLCKQPPIVHYSTVITPALWP